MSPAPRTAVPAPDLAARLMQCVLAGVLAAICVGFQVALHRWQLDAAGLVLPVGLVLGALLETVSCVLLVAVAGSRVPVAVLACAWGIMVMPFAGRGIGGGVLMPAVIEGQAQYSGWILQAVGVLVPVAVILGETLRRRRARA